MAVSMLSATRDTLWHSLSFPVQALLCWLLVINITAFVAFCCDKLLAKGKERRPHTPRIPEKNLFLLALAGGSVGAWLGMYLCRHKTRHASFRLGIPIIFLAQTALAIACWYFL